MLNHFNQKHGIKAARINRKNLCKDLCSDEIRVPREPFLKCPNRVCGTVDGNRLEAVVK